MGKIQYYFLGGYFGGGVGFGGVLGFFVIHCESAAIIYGMGAIVTFSSIFFLLGAVLHRSQGSNPGASSKISWLEKQGECPQNAY